MGDRAVPYADFTLESVEAQFALTTGIGDLFPDLPAAPVPAWLGAMNSASSARMRRRLVK